MALPDLCPSLLLPLMGSNQRWRWGLFPSQAMLVTPNLFSSFFLFLNFFMQLKIQKPNQRKTKESLTLRQQVIVYQFQLIFAQNIRFCNIGSFPSKGRKTFAVVQLLSHVQFFATAWTKACLAPLSSLSPEICSHSCLLSWWCHPIISSSVAPFFRPQSFPASGPFPMSQSFASGGQSSRASASASVLPMNNQGWFPLELIGLLSLQSKGLSRVFYSTTIGKHQFFSAQAFLWSNSHIYTWLLEKP